MGTVTVPGASLRTRILRRSAKSLRFRLTTLRNMKAAIQVITMSSWKLRVGRLVASFNSWPQFRIRRDSAVLAGMQGADPGWVGTGWSRCRIDETEQGMAFLLAPGVFQAANTVEYRLFATMLFHVGHEEAVALELKAVFRSS